MLHELIKNIETNELPQMTEEQRKTMRVQVLTGQISACQSNLDLAAKKVASAQTDMEAVQDGLRVAGQALERVVSDV